MKMYNFFPFYTQQQYTLANLAYGENHEGGGRDTSPRFWQICLFFGSFSHFEANWVIPTCDQRSPNLILMHLHQWINENLNYKDFGENLQMCQVLCTWFSFPCRLQICVRKSWNLQLSSSNLRGYLKNHWTNTRLVCTHLNIFFMLNWYMAMEI